MPDDAFTATVTSWEVDTVAKWITSLGLGFYANKFADNKVNGEALVYINHSDLQELGVQSVGHRLRVLNAVYHLTVEQNLPVDGERYVPPTVAESKYVGWDAVVRSFEIRDERLAQAETEIKRLLEGMARMREDLLPLFRKAKESKPLPTPEFPATTSPFHGPQQQAAASPTVASSYFGSPTASGMGPTSPSQHHDYGRDSFGAKKKAKTGTTSSTNTGTANGTTSNSYQSNPSSARSPTAPDWLDDSVRAPPPPATTTATVPMTSMHNSSSVTLSQTANPKLMRKGLLQVTATPSVVATPTSSTSAVSSSSSESFKSFKVSLDDPCHKVLPAALRKYKINGDPKNYALLVCYSDQERLLGPNEKPLIIFKELQDAGLKPVFMLRHKDTTKGASQPPSLSSTPGGVI